MFEWIQTLSQRCSLSQCSVTLQHLIRTSPIGTRGVSLACDTVHNISLFTHSLFVVYYFILISIFVFLIFSFFFFFLFQSKKIFIIKNELFEWIPTLSQPRSLSQCSITLQHLIRTSPIGTRGVSRP